MTRAPGVRAVWTAVAALIAATVAGAAPDRANPARPAPGGGGKAIVERVDWQSSSEGGRVVVRVEGPVHYSTHAASADPGAGLPPRAYVDLSPAQIGPRLSRDPIEVGDGVLRRIRVGQFDPQTVRIVVDLASPAVFDVRTAERPARLILGLAARPPAGGAVAKAPAPAVAEGAAAVARPPTSAPEATAVAQPAAVPTATAKAPVPEATPATVAIEPSPVAVAVAAVPAEMSVAAASAAPPSPNPAESATPRPPEAEVPPPDATADGTLAAAAPVPHAHASGTGARPRTVVLDPGHGGKDPGARGVTGEVEKDITLRIAELVAERLKPDQNLRVVLTRTDDRYVSLEQRTAVANAQGAELFVSIHANASENPALAGIETYTLNNTNDRATIRLAAMENGLTLAGGTPGERDLAYILSDLLQTGKEDESVALAESVQRELVSYLRARWKDVNSLGVKKGPFYVLVGAYMPCILVETAFLTHETEGERIASRRYQRDVAEGIARGIRRFLASDPANSNL